MSWDVELVDKETKKVMHMPYKHDFRGGNYVLGGTTACEINITYNYGANYRRVHPENGITDLNGMSGKDSVPILADMIGKLGDEMSDDYWEATDGNAKQPLVAMLIFAAQNPSGVWEID